MTDKKTIDELRRQFGSPDDSLKKVKAIKNAKKALRRKEKEVKKRVDRVDSARDSVANLKELIKIADKGGIVEETIFAHAPPSTVDLIKESSVAWQPHPGVQVEFLKATEDEVLFAGGRGSGKSDCLMIDPLRYCDNKNFKGLIIRRTMPELRDLIFRAKEIYPIAYPGCRWKEQEKMFIFPSGARIEFGYCDNIDDVERYRGQQFTWIGLDEITQFPDSIVLEKLKGSLRTTDPSLRTYIRATTNPSGVGRNWVKERWINGHDSGAAFTREIIVPITEFTPTGKLQITGKWFNSTVRDNPTLLQNTQYIATLSSYGEVLKKQWLEGDWNAYEGLAFPDFVKDNHVIQPFEIPSEWYRFRACDWGFSSMAVCLWFAVDLYDNLYIYREFKTKGMDAKAFAEKVLELEEKEYIRYGVLDGSTWSERGQMGETPAETMMNCGCKWLKADRSKGSRIAGKLRLHSYFFNNKIKIFSSCEELIRELDSLSLDPNNPEDVDKTKKFSIPDHAYDALRYGLLSRPEVGSKFNQSFHYEGPPPPVDSTFGY